MPIISLSLPKIAAISFLILVGCVCTRKASAQIFVNYTSTVREYDLNTGAPINLTLVTGGEGFQQMALSGSYLFLTSTYNPAIGEGTIDGAVEVYTTSGSAVALPLLSNLKNPFSITASGTSIYLINDVGDSGKTTINQYNSTTGAAIHVPLVTGSHLNDFAQGIAISGTSLYVANFTLGTVSEYNANTGAVINLSLISGLGSPTDVEVSGTTLFVSTNSGTIGAYNAATGGVISGSLIVEPHPVLSLYIAGNDIYDVTQVSSGTQTVGVYSLSGVPINSDLITTTLGIRSIVVAVPEPSEITLIIAGFCFLTLVARFRFQRKETKISGK